MFFLPRLKIATIFMFIVCGLTCAFNESIGWAGEQQNKQETWWERDAKAFLSLKLPEKNACGLKQLNEKRLTTLFSEYEASSVHPIAPEKLEAALKISILVEGAHPKQIQAIDPRLRDTVASEFFLILREMSSYYRLHEKAKRIDPELLELFLEKLQFFSRILIRTTVDLNKDLNLELASQMVHLLHWAGLYDLLYQKDLRQSMVDYWFAKKQKRLDELKENGELVRLLNHDPRNVRFSKSANKSLGSIFCTRFYVLHEKETIEAPFLLLGSSNEAVRGTTLDRLAAFVLKNQEHFQFSNITSSLLIGTHEFMHDFEKSRQLENFENVPLPFHFSLYVDSLVTLYTKLLNELKHKATFYFFFNQAIELLEAIQTYDDLLAQRVTPAFYKKTAFLSMLINDHLLDAAISGELNCMTHLRPLADE